MDGFCRIFCQSLIENTQFCETLKTLHRCFTDSREGPLEGTQRLVEEFVDAPLVGFLSVHKQTSEDMEAAELVVLLVGGYPLVGLLGGVREVLVEVKSQLFRNLLGGYLLLPYIHHLRKYLVGGHQHGSQYLTLPDILFVQFDGKII